VKRSFSTVLQTIPEVKTIEGSFRPYYEYKWPADLPSHCESCGNEFRTRINLHFGPDGSSQILRKSAAMALLASVASLLLMVWPLAFFMRDNESISVVTSCIAFLAVLGFMAAPVMFFISIFLPEVRQLKCNECDWSRDYPIFKPSVKQKF
jgi:hypothetical protein